MSKEELPYIAHCGFCEQGLLRFRECPNCKTICAVCDECELVWTDFDEVSQNAKASAAGSFPTCPECGERNRRWPLLGWARIEDAELADYIAGGSR